MRVFIVEDDMTIAMMIEDMLEDCGHEVAGIAMRLNEGLERARRRDFDVAVLDVNLDGLMSFPIADVLIDAGVPFLFATGYGATGIPPQYSGVPTLTKPFTQTDLDASLISARPL